MQAGKHRWRDLPGEGALVLPVAVLRAEPDQRVVAFDERLHRTDRGERRTDNGFDLVVILGTEQIMQLLHERDRLEVRLIHLPVAGDDRLTRHYPSFVERDILTWSGTRPGKRFPSRNSSIAPPPVDA